MRSRTCTALRDNSEATENQESAESNGWEQNVLFCHQFSHLEKLIRLGFSFLTCKTGVLALEPNFIQLKKWEFKANLKAKMTMPDEQQFVGRGEQERLSLKLLPFHPDNLRGHLETRKAQLESKDS